MSSRRIRNSKRRATPRGASASAPRRRRAPWLIALVVAVLASLYAAGDWALHLRWFRATTVTISGNVHESYAQVMRVSGLSLAPAMIDIDDGVIARRIERFTWVSTVSVTKHWPHTIALKVSERIPVAVVRVAKGALVEVDRTDRALSVIAVSTKFPQLVVVGHENDPWRFSSWAQPAADVAAQLPVAFSSQVATVEVDRHGQITIALTTPLTFTLGAAVDLHDKFVAIASVIKASAVHHVALKPGDVVDVSVPGTLTVSGP